MTLNLFNTINLLNLFLLSHILMKEYYKWP